MNDVQKWLRKQEKKRSSVITPQQKKLIATLIVCVPIAMLLVTYSEYFWEVVIYLLACGVILGIILYIYLWMWTNPS